MNTARRVDIDALIPVADWEFESSVEHDGSIAACDFDTDRAVSFLNEGAGPDKKESVLGFLGSFPGKSFDLLGFGRIDFLNEADNVGPGIRLA